MTPERWQQVKDLFSRALERESGARSLFLDEACGGDERLRREVELLLSGHNQAGAFLEQPALPALEVAAAAVVERAGAIVGRRFGAYQVLSMLGRGGMGEVYLAEDTRLKRKVALKLLPAQFTADAERVRRFEQEARAASALNHPNIITIHEIGEIESRHYIATEYIEGATLRERMRGEGLSLEAALDVAQQVAGALAAAHACGIMHRDIKPENVMLRRDGYVKVLDFGLAKLIEPQSPVDTQAPTMGGVSTRPGDILGTVDYMSPEQALGEEVDLRTDIFSFGVMLYEMVAGRRPFRGQTLASVFDAILHQEPEPLSALADGVPEELERIVKRAFAKEREKRYQTAEQLRRDLQALRQAVDLRDRSAGAPAADRQMGKRLGPAALARARSGARAGWWRSGLARVLAGVLLAGAVTGAWWLIGSSPPEPAREPRLRISQIVNRNISDGGRILWASFSPDGKLIAYSTSSEEENHLWLKQVGGGEAKRVTGGRWRDRDPVWSPDGQHLAFISNRSGKTGIWSVPYLGETPTLLEELDLVNVYLIGWSKKRPLIYFESPPNLHALDLSSGEITQLTDFSPGHSLARDFSVSPDEERVAYAEKIGDRLQILVRPLRGGEPKQINGGEADQFSPSWFPDGEKIAYSSIRAGLYQIHLAYLDGRPARQLTFDERNYGFLSVSPDGEKILAISQIDNAGIFSVDMQTGDEVKQATDFGLQLYPDVSHRGEMISFQSSSSNLKADDSIFIKPLAAAGQASRIVANGFEAKWSPDGEALAFLRRSDDQIALWRVSASGRDEKRLTAGEVRIGGQTGAPYYRPATNYSWSPDGTKIAYGSARSGRRNLWVVSSDGSQETMITRNEDRSLKLTSPFWSPDGGRIAYIAEPLSYSASGSRSVEVIEGERTTTLFRLDAPLRLLGWSASGGEIYFALGERTGASLPQKVTLYRGAVTGGEPKPIAHLSSVYLHSVKLSPARRLIAFASRREGKDNLEYLNASGGPAVRITGNSDATVYYSGLTWSSDEKRLFYSKQTGWTLVWMIEDF